MLTEAGYQPEIAYFEVFHELKMLVDLANEGGLNKARWSCSDTAQYGDYTSTVITEETKKRMQYQLKRIQDGSFAKEFIDDQDAGAPHFKELQEKYSNERIEHRRPEAARHVLLEQPDGRRCRYGRVLQRQDCSYPGSVIVAPEGDLS